MKKAISNFDVNKIHIVSSDRKLKETKHSLSSLHQYEQDPNRNGSRLEHSQNTSTKHLNKEFYTASGAQGIQSALSLVQQSKYNTSSIKLPAVKSRGITKNSQDSDERSADWREIIQDQQYLIKARKNEFGGKDYRLDKDKAALTLHINSIIKNNLQQSVPSI